MAIDLNDSTTWPVSADELAALAAGIPETEEPKVEDATPPRDEQGRFVKAEEPKAEEPKAEEPKAEEPKADVEAPVLTADGQHYIPHSVLKDARERARQAEQAAQELQRQLAEMTAKAAQTPPAAPVSGTPSEPATPAADTFQALLDAPVALTDADEARIAKYQQEWGEDPADVLRQTLLAARRAERQDELLRAQHKAMVEQQRVTAELQARLEQAARAEQASEGEQIQAAIDQSPLMTAWQADQKSPYFEYSVKLHQYLMQEDPAYAKLSWAERVAVLPSKVEALYGKSPHSDQVGTVAAPPAKLAPVPAKPAAPGVPLSMTDIAASGQPPAITEIEKLERMSPAQVQQHLLTLTPEALKDYLYQFSR
jgi:hypothetical protein